MRDEDVPFSSSPPDRPSTDETTRKPHRRFQASPARTSYGASSDSMDRDFRLALIQTGGRTVHVWDHDVVAVKEVTTQKHGDCLIAEIRGGEQLWLIDDAANRSALSIRRSRG